MNEDGRGFSPCENHAAVAGPFEVMRVRGRRFFLSLAVGATARPTVVAAAEAAFTTIFAVAFTTAFTAAFTDGLAAAVAGRPACLALVTADGLVAFGGAALPSLTGLGGVALRAGLLTAAFFPNTLPDDFFAGTGGFALTLCLAGAAFLTAWAFFAGELFLTTEAFFAGEVFLLAEAFFAGMGFLAGRAPGFAAGFFEDALAAGFEAGLDFCFGRAAVLGLAPFRVLAAAFLACTLAINLSRRFLG